MECAAPPPPLGLWSFIRHSLFREYGWQFFLRIALPHPLKTLRAIRTAAALDVSGDRVDTPAAGPEAPFGGPRAVLGLGFCMKPLDPPCPSGRFNHDCACLEGRFGDGPLPAACRQCAIRELGLLALRSGAAVYIMTSARDILFDLYLPALRCRTFTTGLFTLCRFSLRPFAVGLLAAGLRGRMWPFESGDCRDYPTWLRADGGDKNDRTAISTAGHERLRDILLAAPPAPARATAYVKRREILVPQAAPAASGGTSQ
ncbi:MAG TPA: hypothetical protein P5306_10310 [Kiritimatiellia bacterium]|nr:hypothetical protein [Kiritimatiellia bacterium]